MELKEQKEVAKSRKISMSLVLYIIATIVALIGIVLLVNNIVLFRQTINQYTAKKIPIDSIYSQLVLNKLLPGVLEPIGIYGGISTILVSIGMISKKASKYMESITKSDVCNINAENAEVNK